MNSLDEALEWLYSRTNKIKDIQLKRISFILNELALFPSYRTVLVSGTNGKGSTVAYLEEILVKKGHRVGSFTSPYVIEFNERIKLNKRNISDDEVLYYLNYLKEYSDEYYTRFNEIIPFFELTFIMSLLYFKKNKVDIAIFECGIGGRFDVTNVIDADLSIITSIGYDHLDRLGNTKEEILYHKIGIARPHKRVILALEGLDEELNKYKNEGIIIDNIYNDISDIKVDYFTIFKFKKRKYKTNLLGSFQAYNQALAIEAAHYLDPSIHYTDCYSLDIYMPGRFNVYSLKPMVVVDGAHNISAMEALMKDLLAYNKKINVFYASLSDKDYPSILKLLDKNTKSFIFTYLNDKRALDPNSYIKYITKDYKIYQNILEAFKNIEIPDDEILLITGSLHFVSKILKIINSN